MKMMVLLFALSGLGADQSVVPVNINCGIPPIPPIGCSSEDATCVCDEDGNCRWEFIGCG
jgi:hypothetical protein